MELHLKDGSHWEILNWARTIDPNFYLGKLKNGDEVWFTVNSLNYILDESTRPPLLGGKDGIEK